MSDLTTTSRLYRSLKQDITTCALRPGLPFSEADICRRYRASRTPAREACRRLEREGLVTIVPFRGYFVAPLTLAEFHHLHEVQLIVDPAAAALAAVRAQPAQVKAIEQAAEYAYRVGVRSSYTSFLQRNLNLHVGIAEAAQNPQLVEVVRAVQTRLLRFFYLIIAMDAYGPQLVEEHRQVAAAIRARQPEAARRRAAEHVEKTVRRAAGLFLNTGDYRQMELGAGTGAAPLDQAVAAIGWTALPGETSGSAPEAERRRAQIGVDPALIEAAGSAPARARQRRP
ncbi:MAG: GntR family transcriptional regulator [Terriglobales bacterium]